MITAQTWLDKEWAELKRRRREQFLEDALPAAVFAVIILCGLFFTGAIVLDYFLH